MVHRVFSLGWQEESTEPIPQPIKMPPTNKKGPPTFSTGSPLIFQTPSPLTSPRTVKLINLPDDLSKVTLDEGTYYIPLKSNNPLFDSFIIDSDPHQGTAQISIFQITISTTHEGSPQGYLLIRKIMKHVSQLLKAGGSKPTVKVKVKVKYFLVCPEGGSKNQWKMPPGWETGIRLFDHRGDAFCIRIPFRLS